VPREELQREIPDIDACIGVNQLKEIESVVEPNGHRKPPRPLPTGVCPKNAPGGAIARKTGRGGGPDSWETVPESEQR